MPQLVIIQSVSTNPLKKLRYETGIITFIQLVTVVPLAFINGILDIIASIADEDGHVMETIIFAMIFVLMLAFWFGFVSALGYAAQERRSRFFAKMLIAAELGTGGAALLYMQHPGDILGFFTALIVGLLALWAIVLAFRLHQAKGGRITATTTRRPRRRPTSARS